MTAKASRFENWFTDLADAREKIAEWKQDYNQARPHSALDYHTPEEFAKTAAAGAVVSNYECYARNPKPGECVTIPGLKWGAGHYPDP